VVQDAPICLGNWCPQNYGHSFSGRVTLLQALTRSINVVPVRLSVMLGDGKGAKAGRAKIIATAKAMGIVTPLPDTPSLPIGADAVNVLEHTVAYATFPNRGMAVVPHAVLELRTGDGRTVWRFDREGRKPRRAIPPQVAEDMVMMMNSVVEHGTARRAQLPGIRAAGKTGTTNAYRDAWFVGYTGNYVCGVWFGNDDYTPTNRMTGGSLPAMTWRQVMTYAHQGIDVKSIPGMPPGPAPIPPPVQVANDETTIEAPARPAVLSRRAVDVLLQMERLLDEAARSAKPPIDAASAGEERLRRSALESEGITIVHGGQ
jgi:penicillin-binding protein 1A